MVGIVYAALLWNIFKIKTSRKSPKTTAPMPNKMVVVISVEREVNVCIMYLYDLTNLFVDIKSRKTCEPTQKINVVNVKTIYLLISILTIYIWCNNTYK